MKSNTPKMRNNTLTSEMIKMVAYDLKIPLNKAKIAQIKRKYAKNTDKLTKNWEIEVENLINSNIK